MFQENPNIHRMETRYPEKYSVLFAFTGRLQISPMISMQKLLNKDYVEQKI